MLKQAGRISLLIPKRILLRRQEKTERQIVTVWPEAFPEIPKAPGIPLLIPARDLLLPREKTEDRRI